MTNNSLELVEEHKDWLMCSECGELQSLVAISPEHEMVCYNCDHVLHAGHGRWLEVASALTIGAFVLFLISVFFPVLTLEIGGQSRDVTILDGFWALMSRQSWILAALIITTLFLFPLFEICALLYIVLPYSLNKHLPGQAQVLKWLIQVRAWSMLEVFLLSMVVASVKMADMAVLYLEVATYTLFMLVGVLILAVFYLDKQKLWSWINPNNYYTTSVDEKIYDCRVCHAMVGESVVHNHKACPRCDTDIHWRTPNSLQKTTAFLIAAAVLYIPANVLPIMTYSTLGAVETDTILSGVIALVGAKLYWVAAVVFTASIGFPIFKLVTLTYLVIAVRWKIKLGIKHRAFLFRLTEVLGRWSMVDVFVVTLFVALVQFGFVYTVEPEGAIIAFAAVVVLTMIAAETFDPRLLWDVLDEENDK